MRSTRAATSPTGRIGRPGPFCPHIRPSEPVPHKTGRTAGQECPDMRRGAPLILLVLVLAPLTAQVPAGPPQPAGRGAPGGRGALNQLPQEIPLWNGAAPGALGDTDADRPTLTIHRAARAATGTGVVVAPGGGYGALAMDHEGRQVAAYFNAMGVAAFVLKYRLGPKYRHPIELGDAQRALRLVRSRAQEFGVLPDRIGMMGFSAGGHLTATAGTHFDRGKADAAD